MGSLLHQPLVKLFDVYATAIILGALVFISILVIFDEAFNVSSLLKYFLKEKKKKKRKKKLKFWTAMNLPKVIRKNRFRYPPLNKYYPTGRGRGFQNS